MIPNSGLYINDHNSPIATLDRILGRKKLFLKYLFLYISADSNGKQYCQRVGLQRQNISKSIFILLIKIASFVNKLIKLLRPVNFKVSRIFHLKAVINSVKNRYYDNSNVYD